MQIRSVHVFNYKCFYDSGDIRIPAGFTIITGKNNAGKTALAQALSLTFENKPHRSERTAPTPSTLTNSPSRVRLKISLSSAEFFELASRQGSAFNLIKNPTIADTGQLDAIISVFKKGEIPLLVTYQANDLVEAYLDLPISFVQSAASYQFSIPPKEETVPKFISAGSANMSHTAPFQIAPYLRERIYLFKAERFNVGQ